MDTRSLEFYTNAWILWSSPYLLAFVGLPLTVFEMSPECLPIPWWRGSDWSEIGCVSALSELRESRSTKTSICSLLVLADFNLTRALLVLRSRLDYGFCVASFSLGLIRPAHATYLILREVCFSLSDSETWVMLGISPFLPVCSIKCPRTEGSWF